MSRDLRAMSRLSALGSWPLPGLVLALYFLQAGAFLKPSLQFFWLASSPYLATAVVLGWELALLAVLMALRLAPFARSPWPRSQAFATLALLLAWAGASLLWSQTDKPAESAGYWIQQVIPLLILLEASAFMPGVAPARLALHAFALGLALLAVQAIAFHRLALLSALELDWYKNTYAHAACMLALIAFDGIARCGWRIDRRSAWWIAALVVAGATLVHFPSKTAIGALGVAGCAILVLGGVTVRGWTMALAALGCLALAVSDTMIETWERYQRDAAYASTLSERTVLWEYVLAFIRDNPLLGLGFDGFRSRAPGIFNVGVAHAHNDVLMLLVNLGAFGLACAALWYAAAARVAWVAHRLGGSPRREALLPLALLAYCLVRGLTEADRFLCLLPVDLMPVCLLAVIRAREAEAEAKAGAGP